MGIAIIPRDKKAMKEFVGKTKAWIEGFVEGQLYERDKAEKIIEELIISKEEELILWRNNLGKDGKKLDRKGFHINEDFGYIASGYEQSLKELKVRLRDK